MIVAIALLALTQATWATARSTTCSRRVVRFVVWTVVWTYVPWVLLRAEISLRVLAFTGALIALALTVLGVVGRSTCRSC